MQFSRPNLDAVKGLLSPYELHQDSKICRKYEG